MLEVNIFSLTILRKKKKIFTIKMYLQTSLPFVLTSVILSFQPQKIGHKMLGLGEEVIRGCITGTQEIPDLCNDIVSHGLN